MPFTMPDFRPARMEEVNPYANMISNLLQGYKGGVEASYLKPLTEQELQKAIIANQLSKQQFDWNPKIWQSEIGLRGAQAGKLGEETKWYGREAQSRIGLQGAQAENMRREAEKIKFMLQHPGLMGSDASKEIEALRLIGANVNFNNQSIPQMPQQNNAQSFQGERPSHPQIASQAMSNIPQVPQQSSLNSSLNPSPFNTGNPLVDAILNRRYAQSAYQTQMLQGYNWAHLPVDTKNHLVAQGLGMGIDPMKMMDYINKGYDIQTIAKAEELDPNNIPPPRYFPTTATKTRVQQVEQVGAELDYLSSAATNIISQYANAFAGYSGKRLSDMLSSDPEAQKRFGRYIGALSVQTGISNGRVLLEGGRAGLEVMRMVKDSSLQGIDQNTPIKMSDIAYKESQKTIDEILQKGAKIRTTTGMNPFSEIGRSKVNAKGNNTESGSVIKFTRDKTGKLVRKSK